MKAIEVLFPVFFMMFLGFLSRKLDWITPVQNEGAKKVVFSILIPILIYNILVSSKISGGFLPQIIYLYLAWVVIYLIGKRLVRGKYASISPYLLLTCEGGNVALPLYFSIVGQAYAVNIVTFDVAGILINFGLVPILITRQLSGKADIIQLLKKIFTSSFMLAVILGLVVNLTGLQRLVMSTEFGVVYAGTMTAVTTPITGIILFTLGYDLKVERSFLKSLLGLTAIRVAGCAVIIAGFYLIFPAFMSERTFEIAVLIYFMSPTAFPVPLQVKPLVKSDEEESFMSAFISLFMIITLAVYSIVTLKYM